MCKHRYIPLDLFALQDVKVEALVAEHGMAGWGIYTALLLKLAQQDEDGYTYPNNAKRLANILPKRPRAEVVRSTIEDFGLFEIATDEDGVEYFYSPRLTSHLSTLGGADKKQGEEAAPKKRSYNVSQAVKEGLGRAREAKRNRSKVEDESRKVESKVETKVESKVETKTGKSRKVEKVETKVDESREGTSTLPSTFSSTFGGAIGGVNTPLKEKDKIEDKTLPLTPTGGMERERIELEKIEDLGLRQMVSSLLYPNSDMRDYAKAFNELYATATAGLTEFAQLKTLSRAFSSDAQELFWALVPEDEQGRKVRPSVLDVLGAIEQFRAMLDEAKASSFLRSKPAMATLTWLVKVDNFAKVAAGNYRDASPSPNGTAKPPVGNYSNAMWDKVKAEQAQKEETPEMRAYREKTQAMAKEVMARINQGR